MELDYYLNRRFHRLSQFNTDRWQRPPDVRTHSSWSSGGRRAPRPSAAASRCAASAPGQHGHRESPVQPDCKRKIRRFGVRDFPLALAKTSLGVRQNFLLRFNLELFSSGHFHPLSSHSHERVSYENVCTVLYDILTGHVTLATDLCEMLPYQR